MVLNAESLLEFIRERGDNVTFAELSRLPGAKGDLEYLLNADSNIILWVNASAALFDALEELRQTARIHFRPTSPLTYLIDGMSLQLPVAKRTRPYKKPHWLPCVVKLGPPLPNSGRFR